MLRKTFLADGKRCRVTFRAPAEWNASEVRVLGDFNDWDGARHPLVRRKSGGFSRTIQLEAGRTYRFRYVLDGDRWVNDDLADGYVSNPFGSTDGIVNLS